MQPGGWPRHKPEIKGSVIQVVDKGGLVSPGSS